MDNSVTIPLRTPIVAHPDKPGDVVNSITLREPTGKDMAACGVPVTQTMASPEYGAYVRTMISRLAGIPPSSVDQMHVHDWVEAMTAVMGFLAPPPKSKTA